MANRAHSPGKGKYGDHFEYHFATQKYIIHRPATDDRAEVNYTISESDLMKKVSCSMFGSLSPNRDEVLTLLEDEDIDLIIRPVQRREAIEHTRKLGI